MGFLIGGAGHDQRLAADADIGAEHRAEGGGGAAKFEYDPHFFGHGQAEAAKFLGDREAEQAHLAHFGDDMGGDAMLLLHLAFERAEAFVDEAADGVGQLGEGVGIERHQLSLISRRRSAR